MNRILKAVYRLALMVLPVGCAPAQAGDQDQTPPSEPEFDLQGTWDWYSSAGVLNSCQLQISRENGRWFGRYVQHPAEATECNRLDLRLDRVQVDGARMWLTFKRAFVDELTELRIQFIATNRFHRYVQWGPSDYFVLVRPSVGHVQILFVFTTTCQYCKASLPAWKQIAAELAASERAEVVGVSIDSVEPTRRYLVEHGIELPVVSFTDRRLLALYRAGTTPQTLIIDADGRVGYSHLGAVTDPLVIDSILNAATTVAARVLVGRPNAATAR
ncbi:MAG: TlpA family protein disulfide reductase [Gemmatimonadota bacterium]|nr:MAG: TlpA family protein disulfide reductase [Gemmatimonadota bacterium]